MKRVFGSQRRLSTYPLKDTREQTHYLVCRLSNGQLHVSKNLCASSLRTRRYSKGSIITLLKACTICKWEWPCAILPRRKVEGLNLIAFFGNTLRQTNISKRLTIESFVLTT